MTFTPTQQVTYISFSGKLMDATIVSNNFAGYADQYVIQVQGWGTFAVFEQSLFTTREQAEQSLSDATISTDKTVSA